MKTGTVYKATSKTSGKSYVGFTIYDLDKRKSEHFNKVRCGSKSYFHNALRKYGPEDFTWEILKEEATLEDEKTLILEHQTYGHGYNQTVGGEGTIGSIRSPETRRKLSEASSKPRSEFFKQRAKEVANSPEGRAQRSRQGLGRTLNSTQREALRKANLGKVLSEDTKNKIKEANKQRSPELIEQIRLSQRSSDKVKRKLTVPVDQLVHEFHHVFNQNKSAMGRHYGVSANAIWKKLRQVKGF